jgi:hypothetical protein
MQGSRWDSFEYLDRSGLRQSHAEEALPTGRMSPWAHYCLNGRGRGLRWFGAGDEPDVEVVVAQFREDLSWLDQLPAWWRKTIWNKANKGPADRRLPNIGREAHTYLHHVLENWGNLADITYFLQGNPFDHCPGIGLKAVDIWPESGAGFLADYLLHEDGQGRMNHFAVPDLPPLDLPTCWGRVLQEPPPPYVLSYAGALFWATRERLETIGIDRITRAMSYVSEATSGAWDIERAWPDIVQPEPLEGILTAADPRMAHDLKFLLASLGPHDKGRRTAVFSLGLRKADRIWIRKSMDKAIVLPDPRKTLRTSITGDRMDATLNKHAYFALSPWRRSLWLDADTLALRSLKEAFRLLESEPILVEGTDAVTSVNARELTRVEGLKLPPGIEMSSRVVQAGVVGLDLIRDRRILAAWGWALEFWRRSPIVAAKLFAWWDQGCLLWAIGRVGAWDKLKPSEWNTVIPYIPDVPQREMAPELLAILSGCASSGKSIVERLQDIYPGAALAHFAGGKSKLSQRILDEAIHWIAGKPPKLSTNPKPL